MSLEPLQSDQLRLVAPRAMKGYAQGLGWKPVAGVKGSIAVFSDPKSDLRQLIVPLDETFDDYPESVARVIEVLAEQEPRDPQQLLNHLLLPPADILSFREVSPEVEAGDVSVEHGSRVIEGVRKALLATAHSVVHPQAYHPRLSRDEAKQFLSRCRMTTARGSFVLNVACVLDQPVAIPGMESPPFTRRVTSTLIETLTTLRHATQIDDAGKLVDVAEHKGISANFCEALLMVRPQGDRSKTDVTAEWSRTLLPGDRSRQARLELRQEVFDLAETLAPRLRSLPESQTDQFFGFVDELRGAPSASDPRPSGEIRVTLIDQDEELHARIDLHADHYAIAGEAHLKRKPVMVTGILHRLPRLNRIDTVTDFGFIPIGKQSSGN